MLKTVFLERLAGVLCLVLLVLGTASCLPRTTTPMTVLEYGSMDAGVNPNLLVLMRGMGGGVEDFETFGIIDEFQKRQLPFDIVAPDAHLGYYQTETLEQRLKQDIIDPARRKGYRQIWLAGFSMGGLGSLFYLRSHPRDVDGVILVSPFLGWNSSWLGLRRAILPEISAAGGVTSWRSSTTGSEHWQDLIWTWIGDYSRNAADYPPVFLGYGSEDSLVSNGPALLAEVLPAERVFVLQGSHDYTTFQNLWRTHLDRLEPELNH